MAKAFSNCSSSHVESIPGLSNVERSDTLGWRSLLVTHSRCALQVGDYETIATPDQIICMITSGRGTKDVKEAGAWVSSHFEPGSISLGKGQQQGRFRWDARKLAEPLERLHIFLPDDLLAETFAHFRPLGHGDAVHGLSLMNTRDSAVEIIGRRLVAAMRHGLPDIYAEASAGWLAVHLLANYSGDPYDDDRQPGQLLDARLRRAIEYVDVHLADEVTLASIAKEAGVSKFHFNRLFREAMGTTPVRYLFDRRLDHAAKNLRQADHQSISGVAFSSGFTNVAHFNRFRQRFGMTPSVYRRTKGAGVT